MSEVFETKVVNHRPENFDMNSGLYTVYESNGERLARIASESEIIITSEDPKSTYARWDQVDIHKDRVELHERSGFHEPVRGQFEIELLNEDGGALERRAIGGALITLPKHIPVRVGISLSDPLIWFSRIVVQRVWERRKDDHFLGYYMRVPVTKDIKTERPETELFWIMGAAKDQGIELPEREALVVEERAFETVFENKSDQPIKVFADSGRVFFAVGPKGSALLEAYSAGAMYARYKRITFKKDGRIDLDENPRWKNPYPLSIFLDNQDGAQTESVTLAGQSVNVIRGIPRFCEVWLNEQAAIYKSFTWKRVKVKVEDKSGLRPGYFEEHWELQCVKERRK